mgnify:CR=1 FL=1
MADVLFSVVTVLVSLTTDDLTIGLLGSVSSFFVSLTALVMVGGINLPPFSIVFL